MQQSKKYELYSFALMIIKIIHKQAHNIFLFYVIIIH